MNGLRAWMPFAALLALLTLLGAFYLAREDTFYIWDHAMYATWAFEFFALAQKDLGAALIMLHDSLNADYSRLYALPSLLVFALFEPSRTLYLLTNLVIFHGGTALALGGFAARWLMLSWPRASFGALAALALLPFVWGSWADGFPDLAATMLLATSLALWGRAWPQPSWRAWIIGGILLALAVLTRRHFVYPVAALLISAAIVAVFYYPSQRRAWLGASVAATVMLATLWLLAPGFVSRVIAIDFPALYTSYRLESVALLDRQLLAVGPLLFFAASAGLGWRWRQSHGTDARATLLVVFMLLWGGIWFGWVRFGGGHYLLHVLPIVMTLGLLSLWDQLLRARRGLAMLLLMLGILQAGLCFWWADLGRTGSLRTPLLGLFATPRPPEIRTDKTALRDLVELLHQASQDDDRIAVLASSHAFNPDTVGAVDAARGGARLPLLATPEIDRRDALPLDLIAQASLLVIALPVQTHLPHGQTVVQAPIDLFFNDPIFAARWQKLPPVFQLSNGAQIGVWQRRAAPTPATLAQTLDRLRELTAQSGSPPQTWVLLQAPLGNNRIVTMTDGTSIAQLSFAPTPTRLFFSKALPPNSYLLRGRLAVKDCVVRMALESTDPDGKERHLMLVPLDSDGAWQLPWHVTAGAQYLTLRFVADRPCGAMLEGLRLEQQSP